MQRCKQKTILVGRKHNFEPNNLFHLEKLFPESPVVTDVTLVDCEAGIDLPSSRCLFILLVLVDAAISDQIQGTLGVEIECLLKHPIFKV